jgi:hypothetical protein
VLGSLRELRGGTCRSSVASVKSEPRREAAGLECVSVDAFQRVNRCPLFRGRLNTWIVRRSLRDAPSDARMLVGVRAALMRWFGDDGAASVVAAVRALARRRTLELGGDVAASSDYVSPAPLMLGDSFASLRVEFLYFGAADDLPWPVLDERGAWLPVDCVWALDLVERPHGS